MSQIPYTLSWPSDLEAETYSIWQYSGTGTSSLSVSGITDTVYETTIDDSLGQVYEIRAVYSNGSVGEAFYITRQAPWTRSTLRTVIRSELKDTNSSKYRWSDSEISGYIQDAVLDYSQHLPHVITTKMVLSLDVREYTLPSGVRSITKAKYIAEDSQEIYLTHKPWKGGEATDGNSDYWKFGINKSEGTRSKLGHWSMRGGRIILDFNPETSTYLEITCHINYPIPVFDNTVITVPVEDIELIKLYAMGKATVRVEGQDAHLSRWDETGRRDDNPIIRLTNRYFNAYYQKIKERLGKSRYLTLTRV